MTWVPPSAAEIADVPVVATLASLQALVSVARRALDAPCDDRHHDQLAGIVLVQLDMLDSAIAHYRRALNADRMHWDDELF